MNHGQESFAHSDGSGTADILPDLLEGHEQNRPLAGSGRRRLVRKGRYWFVEVDAPLDIDQVFDIRVCTLESQEGTVIGTIRLDGISREPVLICTGDGHRPAVFAPLVPRKNVKRSQQ